MLLGEGVNGPGVDLHAHVDDDGDDKDAERHYIRQNFRGVHVADRGEEISQGGTEEDGAG